MPQAHASECPKSSPSVSFKDIIHPIEYIRTESAENLTQWQTGHSITAKTVLGVGGGSVGTQLQARYKMVPAGDLFCVIPTEVQAVFYAEPQIHIASNFARGSCEYSEVMAHEQKHITVLKKFHREYRNSYRDFFVQAVRGLDAPAAVSIDDVEASKKQTTGAIMAALDSYTQDMMAVLNDRQRAIDTKEEYERVLSKCKNWTKKLPVQKR